MYNVLTERRAERDLEDLDHQIFRRVIARIEALADNPPPFGSEKIKGSKSDYRIRVGNWRALYEVDDRNKIVKVFRVKHRREAYR